MLLQSHNFNRSLENARNEDYNTLIDKMSLRVLKAGSENQSSDTEFLTCLETFDLLLTMQGTRRIPIKVEEDWRSWLNSTKYDEAPTQLVLLAERHQQLTSTWAENYLNFLFNNGLPLAGENDVLDKQLVTAFDFQAKNCNYKGWNNLEIFITEGTPARVQFALGFLENRFVNMTSPLHDSLIKALSGRFELHLTKVKPYPFDPSELCKPLEKWLIGHYENLSPQTSKALGSLAAIAGLNVSSSVVEKIDKLAIVIAELLVQKHKIEYQKLVKSWIDSLPEKTTSNVDEWIGEAFSREFNSENRKNLIQKLETISTPQTTVPDDNNLAAWNNIINKIDVGVEMEDFQTFVKNLWARAKALVNPVYFPWYTGFFPSMTGLMTATPIDAGDALYDIFAFATGQPAFFAERSARDYRYICKVSS